MMRLLPESSPEPEMWAQEGQGGELAQPSQASVYLATLQGVEMQVQ